ncbi:MAG TPA: hypothetical protein VN657_00660 [Nitrospiraceae bacterium]|nr:hypothetical protein [Nitrospiraceae bacterium]
MSNLHKRLAFSILFFLWLLVPTSIVSVTSAISTIYTYKDDSGTPNYTTELDMIPEKYRSRVVPLDSETPSTDTPAEPYQPPANVRVVTASGEYQMGDHDTRADAVRLAVEAAKRQALEQVATYLESVTEVKNTDITRDDIRTYTAGIVMVLDQKISTRLDGDTVIIHADLTAQVDPKEVAQAIETLRENESAKTELVSLRAETDQLHQQLDAANQALATATSPEQIQTLTQQRQDTLNQLQANALVSQAWTDWVYVTPIIYPYPWIGVQQVHGLLLQARQLNPGNRHLQIVQQAVTAQTGALPPPSGSSSPVLPHASLLVSPPASQQFVPSPFQRHQPGSGSPAPFMRDANPSASMPPQHFSNPLPPTLQQVHPPNFSQPNPPVLRAPFYAPHSGSQMGPQHFGGSGGHSGGGGGRFGGGGGHRGR